MISCPNCRYLIAEKEYKRYFVSPKNDKRYNLYHCPQCDLEYWNPRNIDHAYYEDEAAYAYILFHRGALKLPKWSKWFLETFNHDDAKGQTLLDIGCGNGLFLSEAKKKSYEVHGIDLDKRSIDVAKQTYGIEHVYASTLSDFVVRAKEEGLTFDLITFFEVLEHQPDPTEFLAQVSSLLNPGGRIVGSVPNRDRVYPEGDRNNGDDLPPHHFLWLSEPVLRDMFGRQGWRQVSFSRLGYSLWEYSAWIQNMYFGGFSNKARTVAAQTLLKEKKPDRFAFLDAIKFIRNIVFLPLAILTFPYFIYVNKKGWDLCFEVKT